MATSNLAYRFRHETVRRYEQDIARILQSYPGVTVFYVNNVETFSCRLRDAMNSYREHGWPTSVFDLRKLCESKIAVAIRQTAVLAGSPEEVRAWTGGEKEDNDAGKNLLLDPSVIVEPSPAVVQSLMELHHARLITHPTIISSMNFSPAEWQERYDVMIETLPDGKYKIL